jgi:hypothetical protein
MECASILERHNLKEGRTEKIHLLFTKTSLSPSLGTGAFSSNFKESKPFWPWTVHCRVVVGVDIIARCGIYVSQRQGNASDGLLDDVDERKGRSIAQSLNGVLVWGRRKAVLSAVPAVLLLHKAQMGN